LLGLHATLRKSPESRAVNFLIAALLLAFALTRAMASHAGGQGAFSVAAWVEWMHLLFISLWVGSVVISGWVILPMAEVVGLGELSATGNFLRLLSHYATIAILGIVGTGMYNSYRGLGSVENLFGNTYGSMLMLKVSLVTLAAALGGFNKFIGLPAVQKPHPRGMALPAALGRIVFVLRMESVVLLGVIVAAAVLTSTAPPSI
jgi:putative copper resistance protein D